MKSWRTTIAGIGQFLAVLGAALHHQFDGVDATQADWGLVLGSAAVLFGLLSARDDKVSSEEARGDKK